MQFVRLWLIATVALSILPVGLGHAAEAPFQFQLRSHEGREWTDNDFAKQDVVVVAFLGTECPLVKLYGPRLQALSDEFGDRVGFVGINSNTQDSMTEITAYANRHNIRFPLLKDPGNKLADQFGAERTPEVFVLDQDRHIRYHGRIDDQYDVGLIRDAAETEFVRDAVEQLLSGKSVAIPETEVVGCHIGRVQKTKPTGEITYTKHISRILNKRCVSCHREGELAPFTLTSYEDILGWEDTICEVIEDNRMPPWFANPEHGKFKNDCRLSADEKETIYQWVDNGMPEGDAADLPEPPKFELGWRIPKPDQVFHMPKSFRVPAQGIVDYKHFYVDPGWDEDKYISAAEARPGNSSVVHHILVYIMPPNQQARRGLEAVLAGYAPGSMPLRLEEGVALKVEAGSKLLFELHYTPNGYESEDKSYAGVKFIDKKDVNQLVAGRLAISNDFAIPPGDAHHKVVQTTRPLYQDELLLAMTPHMHLRGKSFRYEANFPNGDKEILLDVPQYDFNWQLKYELQKPKLLPKGTTITCTAVYDNSEANLANPDPSATVRWGNQSWEEMMIGFFDTLPIKSAPQKSRPSVDPTGTYAVKGMRGASVTLQMEGEYVSGTFNVKGQSSPLQNVVLLEDKLSFTASPRGFSIQFDGTVTKDTIRGKLLLPKGKSLPFEAQKGE